MSTRSFSAILHSGHKEDAVEVPFDPSAQWSASTVQFAPGRRGFAVQGKLNGFAFSSHVVARSGRFWLLVDSELAGLATIAAGDSVVVVIGPASDGQP